MHNISNIKILIIRLKKNYFDVEAKIIYDNNTAKAENANYKLEFNELTWDPFKICMITAQHMKVKKEEGKPCRISGKELLRAYDKKIIKKKAEKFYEKKIYQSFHDTDRVGKTGLFKLWMQKEDDSLEKIKDKNHREKFAEAFFDIEGSSLSKSTFALGFHLETEIHIGISIKETGKEKSVGTKVVNDTFTKKKKLESVFSEEFKEYVRFECRTKDLDEKILGNYKGFNVQNINKLKWYLDRKGYIYITRKLITEEKNVLIQGPPDVGKTRLVYEVLKSLNDYYVFSLFQNYLPDIEKLKTLKVFNNTKIKLIWFIDDLHFFYENPQKIYEKFTSHFDNIIVIATLRSDKKDNDSCLVQRMKRINIDVWSEDELKKLSAENSIKLYHKLGNTPSSLIKDFSKLKEIFNRFKILEGKEHCLNALYYIKLLFEFMESFGLTFLERVFLYLRDRMSNKDDFQRALIELEKSGFIEIIEGRIQVPEIFFVEIITDRDYYNLIEDAKRLKDLFIKNKLDADLNRLGCFLTRMGCLDEALNIYNDVIKLNPKMALAYSNKSYIYDMKGEYDQASEGHKKAIDIDPKNSYLYYFRGKFFYKHKKYNLAAKDYLRILELDPNNNNAHVGLGNIYSSKGKFDGAIRHYTNAIRCNLKDCKAYLYRGYTYIDKNEFELAKNDFYSTLKLDPSYYCAYNGIGLIHNLKGEYEFAIKYFSKAIEIHSHNYEALFGRGFAYYRKGEYKLALSNINKSIAINPSLAITYDIRGRIYAMLKQDDLAMNDLNRAISIEPHYQMYLIRGCFYLSQNNIDNAIMDFETVINLKPYGIENYVVLFADAYLRRASKNEIMGKYFDTMEDLRRAVTLYPDLPDILPKPKNKNFTKKLSP